MTRFSRLLMALLPACLAFSACEVHAEQVTVAITAQVTSRSSNSPLVTTHVNVGDTVTGFYVFDTDTPDGNPSSLQGVYRHTAAEHGIALEINGLQFASDPAVVDFTMTLSDNLWGPGRGDTARLVSTRNLYSPGVPASTSDITVYLYERASTALSSDLLTADAVLAPQWYAVPPTPFANQAKVTIYGADSTGKFQIDAKILSAQQVVVP